MYLPNVINENTITVFLPDGTCPAVTSDHPSFAKIKALLLKGEHDGVPALMDMRKGFEKMGGGLLTVSGNEVLYMGRSLQSYQAQKLMSMFKQGHQNIKPYSRFVERLEQNPSFRAREEFARFADYEELPIDEEGFVYAWRGLLGDYYSRSGNLNTRVLKGKVNASGQILNEIGAEIEVERADVDDNCNRTCSQGLHVGSLNYARGWSGGKLVLVKFDPKDVVSVPTDCNGQKCRVCRYWVLSDYVQQEPIKEAVVSNKAPSKKKITEKSEEAYRKIYFNVARKYKLTHEDGDAIREILHDHDFCDDEIIDTLVNEHKIAFKIGRYVDRNGGEAPHKRIQSALKSHSLKYEDIDRIYNWIGELV